MYIFTELSAISHHFKTLFHILTVGAKYVRNNATRPNYRVAVDPVIMKPLTKWTPGYKAGEFQDSPGRCIRPRKMIITVPGSCSVTHRHLGDRNMARKVVLVGHHCHRVWGAAITRNQSPHIPTKVTWNISMKALNLPVRTWTSSIMN